MDRAHNAAALALVEAGHCSQSFVEDAEEVSGCFTKGGFVGSIYLLASASLGVGVFALPQALNLSGWLLGSVLLAVFACVTNFTSWIIVQVADQLKTDSFEETVNQALGRVGSVYFSAAMAITCFIGNAAQIQTVGSMFGDLMYWFVTNEPNLVAGEWRMEEYKKSILYGIMLSIALPFCFQSSIGNLQWVGTLSVVVVLVNAAMIVCYCAYLGATGFVPEDDGAPLPPSPAFRLNVGDLFRAAGVVCFLYTPIFTLFPVRKEMIEPSRAPQALRIATLLCFIAFLITGLAGNLVFRSATQSNIIYNTLPQHRMLFRPCWLALVVCITLLHPIVNFQMVVSIEAIFGRTVYSRQLISTLGCVLIVVVTLVVSDITDVFGLCSSLGLGSVMFVIPCWCYLKVDPSPIVSRRKIGAVISLAIGLSIVFVSTGFIFMHIACVHTKGADQC